MLTFSCFAFSSELNVSCQAKLRVHTEIDSSLKETSQVLALDIAIDFLDNNQLVVNIEGETDAKNGGKYTVSRYLTYQYRKLGYDFYLLDKKSTERLSIDNYPNDNFTELYGLDDDHSRVKITKLNGNYLFSNLFSPVFLCMVSD
jgi:hypothetical protein